MKVFIITEGGKGVGLGHISRCIALYDAFTQRNITPTFILNSDLAEDLMAGRKFKAFNWLKDEKKTLELLNGADIAVIDSYLAPLSFYKKVAGLVRLTVYIDDSNRLDYPKGIVINSAIYAEKIAYPKKDDILHMLGIQYLPLRKEFEGDIKKSISDRIKNVIITFGGNDSGNITPKILNFLNENYPALIKNVVIGAAFEVSNIEKIKRLKNKNVNLTYYPDAEKMRDIMLESDVTISAGGQTLYELAGTGVPTIGICIADNQIDNLKGLEKAGFVKNIGWYEEKDLLHSLKKAMGELEDVRTRQKMSDSGQKAIDGKGSLRIVNALLSGWFRNSMSLRSADFNDASRILDLANDDMVRHNSFNTKKIGQEEHTKWFKEKMNDRNCVFFIVKANGNFCGVVRFDINPDKKDTVINIGLKKDIRGLGLAKFVINKSISELLKIRRDVRTVRAYIKEENMPSCRSFEKSGFKSAGEAVVKGNKAKVFTREMNSAAIQNNK